MPHVVVDGKPIDLQLELHSAMTDKEFIQYIQDLVSGKSIAAKITGFKMEVNKENVKEFCSKLLKNTFFKNYAIYHYSEEVWSKVETLLKSKL